jgi:hypothetical protein
VRLDVIFSVVLTVGATAVPIGAGRAYGGPAVRQAAQPPFTSAELDLLLAPVALYPDQLLAQMLLGAASPTRIVELDGWLKRNTTLKGTELQTAAEAQGFEPSLVTLAMFPQVVTYMADDVTWTTQIGQAFTADRKAVLASVQRLRAQSQQAGALKSTPQQQVETRTTDSGQQVIVIEPTNPQVVYVPQYNAQTVYTQPSTVTIIEEDDDDGAAVAAGVIGFTAGIAIGAAMDNDYYYGPYGWRGGAYMYDDAWDDYYDEREDAREDWQDHREDIADERGERAGEAQEQRTERAGQAQEQRTERAGQTEQARTQQTQARTTQAQPRTASQEARGTGGQRAAPDRSGAKSDAFSGYSSGKSERAASSRGSKSRSRSGGGRSRR